MTRAALVGAGVDATYGDRRARAGAWLRLAPSVYLLGEQAPTDRQLVRAARAHAGEDCVVTGLVACRALGLSDVPAGGPVEVLVPPGRRAVSSRHVVVHESQRRQDVVVDSQGVSWAGVAQAVADGARCCPDLRTTRALVLAAVAARRCSAESVAEAVEAGPQRGSGLGRRAADDALAGAWSAPEAEAADVVRPLVAGGRLPPFLLNPRLLLDGTPVGRPDGWLCGTRVCWQVDSRRHHEDAGDFDRTLALHDAYAAAGFVLLHVTPRRLRLLGPAWAEQLVAAVAADDRRPPLGLTVEPLGPVQRGPLRRPLAA